MSIGGHLLCDDCRERIHLGKWLRDEDDKGIGFHLGSQSDEQLGARTLAFLARHMKHTIRIVTDSVLDKMDNLDDYRSVDREYGDPCV